MPRLVPSLTVIWSSPELGRKSIYTFNFGPRLLVYQDVVIFAGGDRKMHAFGAEDGEKLWESDHARGGYQSPEDEEDDLHGLRALDLRDGKPIFRDQCEEDQQPEDPVERPRLADGRADAIAQAGERFFRGLVLGSQNAEAGVTHPKNDESDTEVVENEIRSG